VLGCWRAERAEGLVLTVLRVLMVPRVLMVLVLGVPGAWAQSDRTISGTVIDAATGKPLSGATVSVIGANLIAMDASGRKYAGPPRVLTAADGRFVFPNLPDGSYSVTATKNGYAEGAFGRRHPSGASKDIALSASQRSTDVVVPVWKNAVISGTLTDEAGEPVVEALLRAFKATVVGGVKRFTPADQPAFTDDRGEYRFSDLLPGDYIVEVTTSRRSLTVASLETVNGSGHGDDVFALPGTPTAINVGDALYGLGRGAITPPPVTNGHLMAYPPTFYPSALSPADAAIVTVVSGEERSSIAIQVQPVPTGQVTGVVMRALGPAAGESVELRAAGFDVIGGVIGARYDDLTARTDSSGQFVFAAVPYGDYVLRVDLGSGTGAEWAQTGVSVSGDAGPFVLHTHDVLQIGGRFVFETGNGADALGILPNTTAEKPTVFLEPVDPGHHIGNGLSMSQGERGFSLTGFTPGRYLVTVTSSPREWMFKSATLNGADVSDAPFEITRDVTDLVITFTDRISAVGGTVRDAHGNPDANAAVLVFPTNAAAWTNYGSSPRRLKDTTTNARGEFGITPLPPGDYFVIAVPQDDAGDWRDPRTLDAMARAAETISIGEGEHRTITVQTKAVPR
jgi:protocatechuate 3,4-dioxygenase beta subunit